MNKGHLLSSTEEAKDLLNKFYLLKNSSYINSPISDEFVKVSRKEDFITTYTKALTNNDYHLLLFDDSFLQFELFKQAKKTIVRYSYYQSPFDYPTYEEYLKLKDLEFNTVGYEYKDKYDQELIEAPKKESFRSVRYDYSEKEYTQGVHSVSHFHIGFRDSIRITSSIFITPLLFVVFIIKNVYFKEWPLLIKDDDFRERYNKVKNKCEKIEDCYFNDIDKKELYLM